MNIGFQVNGSRFNYSLYLVPDNLYGVYDHDTKEWNGIVRKVFFSQCSLQNIGRKKFKINLYFIKC